MVQFLESFQSQCWQGGDGNDRGATAEKMRMNGPSCPSAEWFGTGVAPAASLREAQGSQDAPLPAGYRPIRVGIMAKWGWQATAANESEEGRGILNDRISSNSVAGNSQGPRGRRKEHFRCLCCPPPLSLFPSFLSFPNPISTFLFSSLESCLQQYPLFFLEEQNNSAFLFFGRFTHCPVPLSNGKVTVTIHCPSCPLPRFSLALNTRSLHSPSVTIS